MRKVEEAATSIIGTCPIGSLDMLMDRLREVMKEKEEFEGLNASWQRIQIVPKDARKRVERIDEPRQLWYSRSAPIIVFNEWD